MIPSRRRSPFLGRPPSKKRLPPTPTTAESAARHEARRALSAQVGLVSPLLRKNPHVSTNDLARALGVSPKTAASVRHAFHVQTDIRVNRILERFRGGQSVKIEDIMRDLAVDREVAEWLGRKTADKILAMEGFTKKKKR